MAKGVNYNFQKHAVRCAKKFKRLDNLNRQGGSVANEAKREMIKKDTAGYQMPASTDKMWYCPNGHNIARL